MKKIYLSVFLLLLSIVLVGCMSSPKNSKAVVNGTSYEGLKKAKVITKKSGDTIVNYYELTFEEEYYGVKGQNGKVYEYEYGYLAERNDAWHHWSKEDITFITLDEEIIELISTSYYASEVLIKVNYTTMLGKSKQSDVSTGLYKYPVYEDRYGSYYASANIMDVNGRINYMDRDRFGQLLDYGLEPYHVRIPKERYYYTDDKGFINVIDIEQIKTYKKTFTMVVPLERVTLIWG